jgi:hypothetical protein
MVYDFESRKKNNNRITFMASISMVIFLTACFFGEGLGGSWGSKLACPPYLGCTSGFFGYDAIEHFLFGITLVYSLIWIFKKFPKFSLLYSDFWKNVIIFITITALISVLWELLECAHDAFRVDILHERLRDIRLHINLLDQPTNIDTMGDLAFSLLGSFFTSLFSKQEQVS